MLRIYSLKSCDTCRKAIKALEAAGQSLEITDIRADGVPREVLAGWLAKLGPEILVNIRSTTWRGLGETDRARAASVEGALDLLLEHPTLMKRPVIVAGETVHVGWTKEVQAALL
ncbi:MAG: Spx/MgsR family RNA polymerase-binding regulatory protein [Pseudomonadota bacterium]